MALRTLNLGVVLTSIGLSAAACGGPEASWSEGQEVQDPEQIEESAQALPGDVAVDFESYATGRLGSPWSVSSNPGGASRAMISTDSGHGKVLVLQGGSSQPNYLMAQLSFSMSAGEAALDVDLKPDAGASFVFAFQGSGSSIGARRIRLQRAPGSSMLVANTVPGGDVTCGALPSGSWSHVTLSVNSETYPHTFDVSINGRPTSCTRVVTGLSAPFNRVTIQDASNPGWGGAIAFDNLTLHAG